MSRLQILEPNASLRFECDGADLHYEVWEPENAVVRGTLYHSHGVCESNETTNTQRLVQRAVARGWRVVCLEHEGHGLSSARAPSFQWIAAYNCSKRSSGRDLERALGP